MTRLHPLYASAPLPRRLNNPFGYIPSPLCRLAAAEVQRHIASVREWQEELSRGKMFGVLVVEDGDGRLGFLAAYSGLLADRNDWEWFVPPVYDFLQPQGHFKQEEAAISHINRQLHDLEQSERWQAFHQLLEDTRRQQADEEMAFRQLMAEAKKRRDQMRYSPSAQTPTEAELTRESQKMKADLKRLRKRHADDLAPLWLTVKDMEEKAMQLKNERKQRSETLQRWLFSHFTVTNVHGEERTLLDIFSHTATPIPPSGSGECCAPKLLQYAFKHHLRPISIAEFWWGASPVGTLRRHLDYYPACRGKCLPILSHMLQGTDIDDNPWEKSKKTDPEILYEDDWLMVLVKPAGMLSVPGKISQHSVWSFVSEHCPGATGPLLVHRLDMATSGLILAAKTKQAHQHLQAQFHHRTIEKTYVALLEAPLPPGIPTDGTISLPLSADPLDRPRQCVDPVRGKPAITQYTIDADRQHVVLRPKTGRTHQLRVHCAHPQGLNGPIKGDTLYGTPSDRLYLHAQSITFTHPVTGARMTFRSEAYF